MNERAVLRGRSFLLAKLTLTLLQPTLDEAVMHKIALLLTAVLLLSSCGTAKGFLDGTGSVLEGMATDVRSLGGMLN